MRVLPFVVIGLAAFGLACGLPSTPTPPPPPPADVVVPQDEPPTEAPPPGGRIEGDVIYAADGTVFGCVGGGNGCAAPPAEAGPDPLLALCEDVDAIRDAELAWRDEHGVPSPAQPTPRRVGELDATAVAWPRRSDFEVLGWSPGARTAATYWVDTPRGGGFEVHGLARAESGWLHCFANADQGAVDTPWRAHR